MTTPSLGASLVEQFDRMVRRDGGRVTLLDATADQIRVGYRPGSAGPDCTDDVCVLPEHELRLLMQETLSRRSPGTRLVVEVVHD